MLDSVKTASDALGTADLEMAVEGSAHGTQ